MQPRKEQFHTPAFPIVLKVGDHLPESSGDLNSG
jgi:hypothetical protein